MARKAKQKENEALEKNTEASEKSERNSQEMTPEAKNPFVTQTPAAQTTLVNSIPSNTTPAQAQVVSTPTQSTLPATIPTQPQQPHNYTAPNGLLDVTLDTEVKLNLIDKFPDLGKEEGARLALISFDEKQSPLIKMCQYLFVEISNNNKLGFQIPKDPQMVAKIIAKFGGEPKFKFGTIVLKYFTDKNGTVMQNAQGTFDYTLHVLTFGSDKWPDLQQNHKKWNLFNHDLSVKCKDPTFQKWSIIPEPDCFWKSLPNANEILEEAKNHYNNSLKKFLPRDLSDQELNVKLGFIQAPAQQSFNPFNPQAQLAGQVGAAAPANPFSAFVKPT